MISLREIAKNIRLASNSSRLACLSLPSARVLALKTFATILSSSMAILKTSLLVHTMPPMVPGKSSLPLSLRESFHRKEKSIAMHCTTVNQSRSEKKKSNPISIKIKNLKTPCLLWVELSELLFVSHQTNGIMGA